MGSMNRAQRRAAEKAHRQALSKRRKTKAFDEASTVSFLYDHELALLKAADMSVDDCAPEYREWLEGLRKKREEELAMVHSLVKKRYREMSLLWR